LKCNGNKYVKIYIRNDKSLQIYEKNKIPLKNNNLIDTLIIGGGLAGLVSAIHLSKRGIKVLVIEKNAYPKHKVCGEYISNEVLPYLRSLDFDPFQFGAKKISKFMMSSSKGKVIKTILPLGGFGLSRFTFDYELSKIAKEKGVIIIQDIAVDVHFTNDIFTVYTKLGMLYHSKLVIGAFGKRSNIDLKLERPNIKNKSVYLAVKAHYKGSFPEDLVALHNFKGGYCGISKVENNEINICYITDYKSFKKYKNINDFQKKVVYKNKYLKTIFENSELSFSKPIAISHITFSEKKPIDQHIIMCGDTAGMIHPLCGNGMAMAIHSAKIASSLIIRYFNGDIRSKAALEKQYSDSWNAEFRRRLKTGRRLAVLLNLNNFSEIMMFVLKIMPGLFPLIIKKTHGKPLTEIIF